MKKHILLSAFFGTALLLLAGCSGNKAVNKADGQQLFIGEDIAVANTQYGKVRGYILRDLYTFKGIPYGANTTGKNRFMPPQEPEPWDGVRLALNYGDMAPQAIVYDRSPESAAGFVDNWNFFNSSEDCLRLNVWTHGLDAKKRPSWSISTAAASSTEAPSSRMATAEKASHPTATSSSVPSTIGSTPSVSPTSPR